MIYFGLLQKSQVTQKLSNLKFLIPIKSWRFCRESNPTNIQNTNPTNISQNHRMSQVESAHQVHLPAPHSTNTLCSQNFFNIKHQVILLPAKCYLVCIINIYRWIATFCAKKKKSEKMSSLWLSIKDLPAVCYHSQHSVLTAD